MERIVVIIESCKVWDDINEKYVEGTRYIKVPISAITYDVAQIIKTDDDFPGECESSEVVDIKIV